MFKWIKLYVFVNSKLKIAISKNSRILVLVLLTTSNLQSEDQEAVFFLSILFLYLPNIKPIIFR
jgi:hypothetical protein